MILLQMDEPISDTAGFLIFLNWYFAVPPLRWQKAIETGMISYDSFTYGQVWHQIKALHANAEARDLYRDS